VRIYVGAMVAMLAFAAFGCGSGSETTETALTKAQFIKRGDAICRAEQEEKEKAVADWYKANGEKALADLSVKELDEAYLSVVLPHIRHVSNRLAELNPPAGDVRASKVVQSLSRAVHVVGENPRLAIKGAPYTQADRLAQAYGFEACGLF
jgi:hypothetical protein